MEARNVSKKTPLQLVGNPPAKPQPPRSLGKHGLQLWQRVTGEYQVTDSGGQEMLAQACEAANRAQECSETIDKEGGTFDTDRGPKEHPLLKIELANRAFVVRTLQKLGLNYEPVRPTGGRPGVYR
jgi:P27 family predicted phage terminase small subunit